MKSCEWLEKFADSEYAKHKSLNRTASLNKVCEQMIVPCEDVPDAKEGNEIEFKYEGKVNKWKVVNTSFVDEAGPGIVLERLADGEDESGESDEEVLASLGDEQIDIEDETTEPIAQADGQKQCTDAPERSYTDPGNVYDLDPREVEIQKFQEEAKNTENQINQEHSVDMTTPAGRYSGNKILMSIMTEEPEEVVEQPKENQECEDCIDIVDEEEMPNEVDEEEVPAEDEFEVEEIEDEDEEKKDKVAAQRIIKKIMAARYSK